MGASGGVDGERPSSSDGGEQEFPLEMSFSSPSGTVGSFTGGLFDLFPVINKLG